MLVIHDSLSYQPGAFILDSDGKKNESKDKEIKIVGFHFNQRPDASLHVDKTISKIKRRFWMLRHLKRCGFTNRDVVKVYKTNLRSALEFASVVYGPLLTSEQANELEKATKTMS